MRHLPFDLSQELAFTDQELRNLDEERGRISIVMMALEPIRRQPVRSDTFGRRPADTTLH